MFRHIFSLFVVSTAFGCVATIDGADKNRDGQTEAACVNACVEQTGNNKRCTDFATEARRSCADFIASICAAENDGKCGS